MMLLRIPATLTPVWRAAFLTEPFLPSVWEGLSPAVPQRLTLSPLLSYPTSSISFAQSLHVFPYRFPALLYHFHQDERQKHWDYDKCDECHNFSFPTASAPGFVQVWTCVIFCARPICDSIHHICCAAYHCYLLRSGASRLSFRRPVNSDTSNGTGNHR
jgi:hypothetical protein